MNINPVDGSGAIPSTLIPSPAVSFSQECRGKRLVQLHGGTLPKPFLGHLFPSASAASMEHGYL